MCCKVYSTELKYLDASVQRTNLVHQASLPQHQKIQRVAAHLTVVEMELLVGITSKADMNLQKLFSIETPTQRFEHDTWLEDRCSGKDALTRMTLKCPGGCIKFNNALYTCDEENEYVEGVEEDDGRRALANVVHNLLIYFDIVCKIVKILLSFP